MLIDGRIGDYDGTSGHRDCPSKLRHPFGRRAGRVGKCRLTERSSFHRHQHLRPSNAPIPLGTFFEFQITFLSSRLSIAETLRGVETHGAGRNLPRDNQGETAYCLSQEYSPSRNRCLIGDALVASCVLHSFVRPALRAFFRPDQRELIASARSGGQGWPLLRPPDGLVLDGREHDDTLLSVGTRRRC